MNMMDALNAFNARVCEINEALPALDDATALTAPALFPVWTADMVYEIGTRLRHEGKLYRVRQTITSSALYPPGATGTEALYAEVEKPGQGDTPEDPIPYAGNMELYEGKYYAQDGVTYLCTRGTGAPVYHPLAQLVGLYVEVVA